MSSPVVGGARIEITGDLDKFANGTQAKIAQSMTKVQAEVKDGLGGLDGIAQQDGEKAGKRFAGGMRDKVMDGLGKLKEAAKGKLGDLGLGVAIAGAFASAIGTAQNQHKLAAVLGLSPADARDAAKLAGKVYADNYGESLDDVNGAIAAVKQNLGDLIPPNMTKDTTELSLAFRDAFGAEPQESLKAVAQMLRTGVAKNAQEAFDIITTGQQNGANKADDLLDTFNEYSTQFRKLGIDGPEALGLINQAMRGGARDSDLAADALKEFSLRAVDGSTTTSGAFKSIGLDAKQMAEDIAAGGPRANAALGTTLNALRAIKDPVQQAQAAAALFGSQAEDLGGALYKLDPATATASKGMENLKGSSSRMNAEMSASASPIDVLKRQAMGLWTSFAAHLVPVVSVLSGAMVHFGPVIIALAGAFAGMLVVTKVAQAISAFNKVMIENEIRQKIVTAATKLWTAAQWLFNAAMSANPVMLLVIALAALAAGLYVAYQHFGPVRDAVNAVGSAFAWLWHTLLEPIVDFFQRNWKTALKIAVLVFAPFIALPIIIVRKWGAITHFFAELGGKIKGVFSGAGHWLVQFGSNLIGGLYSGARSAWRTAWAWFTGLPGAIGRIAASLGSHFWNGLKSVVADIGNLGKTMYNAIVDTINSGLIDPIKHWHFTIGAFGVHHTFQPFGGIPDIPRLAKGGMTQGQGTFVMGDNPSGQEVALPLDSPATIRALSKAMASAADSGVRRQLAGGNHGTSQAKVAALKAHTGGHEHCGLSEADRELLAKLASRPVSVKVGSKEVAWAANDGNLALARRSGGSA